MDGDKKAAATAAQVWAEGYQAGIDDERTSEANIGIAGFGAKVQPARNNPYGATPAPVAQPDGKPASRPPLHKECAMFPPEERCGGCGPLPPAAPAPVLTTAQQRADEMLKALRGVMNLHTHNIHTASAWDELLKRARAVFAAIEAPGQEVGSNG